MLVIDINQGMGIWKRCPIPFLSPQNRRERPSMSSFLHHFHSSDSVRMRETLPLEHEVRILWSQNFQALFWSAHRRISAHFPRISDPSEIRPNLLRQWIYIRGGRPPRKGQNSPKSPQNGPFQPRECSVRAIPELCIFPLCWRCLAQDLSRTAFLLPPSRQKQVYNRRTVRTALSPTMTAPGG